MALTNNPLHSYQIDGEIVLDKSSTFEFSVDIQNTQLGLWGKCWQIAIKDFTCISSPPNKVNAYYGAFFNVKCNFVTGINCLGNVEQSVLSRLQVNFSQVENKPSYELRYVPLVWFYCNSPNDELKFIFENYPAIQKINQIKLPVIKFVMTFVLQRIK